MALEAASGRPTVWSTAQYLSYAPTHTELDLTVTLAAEGRRVTQARAVGYVGDTEILTVNAALGSPGSLDGGGVWVTPPEVPPPDECPPRRLPDFNTTSVFDRIDVRLALGRSYQEIESPGAGPGDPRSALWARVPGHLEPSAATLAIIGDYVTGGVSQPLARRVMSPEPRQHDPGGPSGTHRVGAVRHPHPGHRGRVRPGGGVPVVRAGGAVGHGQPVDGRASLALSRVPSGGTGPAGRHRVPEEPIGGAPGPWS